MNKETLKFLQQQLSKINTQKDKVLYLDANAKNTQKLLVLCAKSELLESLCDYIESKLYQSERQ